MKVRISNDQIRYRLDSTEVDALCRGEVVAVGVDESISFSIAVGTGYEPLWTLSDGDHALAIPISAFRSPSTADPLVYCSPDTTRPVFLVELDLKPHHP
jgi:hypothetical protein